VSNDTAIDLRKRILTDLIIHKRKVLTAAMRPPGSNIPLTTQQTQAEALVWWRRNRYTPTGQKILASWKPAQVLALDAVLARHPDPALEQPLLG